MTSRRKAGGISLGFGLRLQSDVDIAKTPTLLPVRGYRTDPPLSTVTGWRDALLTAGFHTVEYAQSQLSIAADAIDLGVLTGILADLRKLARRRFALLAHSRGGLVARSFLGAPPARPSSRGRHRSSGCDATTSIAPALIVPAPGVVVDTGLG